MKKILKYIAIALVPLLWVRCHPGFLERNDPDAFDVPKFYKSEQDMEDALSAAYEATRSFYKYMYYVTEMKSDNATTSNTGDSGGLYSTFVTHNVTSSNTIVAAVWNGLYNCIYKSNLVLKYIGNVKMSEDSRARITAEAKFLRALAHFYLIRLYGEVPVCSGIIETTGEAKAARRQPLSDAYDLMIEDLKEVADCQALDVFHGDNDTRRGHATRTAGAALLGKVYITLAATTNQKSYYTDAVTYLNRACELKGITELPTTFPKVFGVDNEGNEEIIFQCMFLGTSTEYSTFAYDFQPYGQSGLISQKTGRGCNLGEENLFTEFEARDRRQTTSIIATADKSCYYTKKYVDLSSGEGLGGNNWIELRFADVFLLLAEAYEQTGDQPNAILYLDKVRTKHGALSGYEISKNDPEYRTKCPTLRDAIFHERRVELAFENHRWFDLQRLYPDKTDFVAYMRSLTGVKYTSFQEAETLLPIPYDEGIFNASLHQNPGY